MGENEFEGALGNHKEKTRPPTTNHPPIAAFLFKHKNGNLSILTADAFY